MKGLSIACGLTGICLIVSVQFACAQNGFEIPTLPFGPAAPPKLLEKYTDKPSIVPAVTLSTAEAGFSIPGDSYLLRQQSILTLDFLDEERILFSFHVASGLIARRTESEGDQQRIRAVVVNISTKRMGPEAEWVVPGRSRYLWMLNDGHFLLRVKDGLDIGDSQLQVKEYLRLPGKLMWIQMDPKQKVLLTNSLEVANEEDEQKAPGMAEGGKRGRNQGGKGPVPHDVLVVRTIERETGKVMRVTRVPWTSQKNDWPLNSEGYIERVHENFAQWSLRFTDYSGGEGRVVARVKSTCPPKYGFISDSELLVSRCDPEKGWMVGALSSGGEWLWETKEGTNTMWPLLVTARNGSRVAREMLLLRQSTDRYKRMIGAEHLLGQVVKVFDATDGKVLLEAPLAPILDGGGNVAISPSGRRAAILNSGAIQVFQFPVVAAAAQ